MELDKSLPWEKVAEPQQDFTDLDILWYAADRLYNYKKPDVPKEITLLGKVSVNLFSERHQCITLDEYLSNNLNEMIETTLRLTPYAEHVSRFLDVYYPYIEDQYDSLKSSENYTSLGCSCGPRSKPVKGLISVASTYNNAIGASDGIIHEVWHQRMHALGIDFETHAGLFFSNADDELYISPIRKDKLRPMPAVIQAQYSYIGVTEYYKILIDQLFDSSNTDKCQTPKYTNLHKGALDSWLRASSRNVFRIREGVDTIQNNVKPTPDIGERFMFGYMQYANRVIQEAIDQIKYYENLFNVQYDWGQR